MKTFIYPEDIREDKVLSKYYQIYTQLKKELFFGNHKAGERFYSVRDLQEKYSVNTKTIRTSIALLANDGFVVNKPARGLYLNRTTQRKPNLSMGNIWFFQPSLLSSNNPYYNGVLSALQRKAGQIGLNVIVNRDADTSGFANWFHPETGDGLVVTGEFDDALVNRLRKMNGLRYVVVGNYDLPKNVPNVHVKIRESVYKSMELCAQSGRHRVAVIANPNAKVAVKDITAGIEQAVAKGLVRKVGEVLDLQEDGYAGMLKLKDSGCDSVLVSEAAFFGLCRYVFEHRIKCPEELFVIRYGKNEDNDIYSDVAAVNVMSDKTVMAEKIISTLFCGGPVRSELDCEVVRIFPDAVKIK